MLEDEDGQFAFRTLLAQGRKVGFKARLDFIQRCRHCRSFPRRLPHRLNECVLRV